jgi:membrane-associated phospholipid phosphatase
VSDRHHFTDVLAGALAGLATGLLLPYLLHYGRDPTADGYEAAGAGETLSAPVFAWRGSF